MKKQIGFIGLGRMGSHMVLNLIDKKYKVVVYNRSPEPVKKLSKKNNVIASYDLEEFVGKIPKPRVVWIMITAGKAIDSVIDKLTSLLSKGDTIIDGGNSFYEDSIKRYEKLKKKNMMWSLCRITINNSLLNIFLKK
ncbi:NAD(P)-binding domain-containing protein [archaeon]|nr:NAD(P)-binding domain-containing protein [archaeon]